MRATQCLCNSRQALYRVFVSPIDRTGIVASRQLPLLLAPATTTLLPGGHVADQIRTLTRPARPPQRRGDRRGAEQPTNDNDDDPELAYERRFLTQVQHEASGRGRLPQDFEITDPKIMVIDNGVQEGPLAPRVVMASLRPEESLRMVRPYVAAVPKDSRPAVLALCKIVNKRDEFERQREVRERKKETAKPRTKALEMSWAIGPHDLGTKMRRLGEFLGKGYKVEVAFGKKKGGKRAGDTDAAAVLKAVKEEIEALGGKEKTSDGAVGERMVLTVEPKSK